MAGESAAAVFQCHQRWHLQNETLNTNPQHAVDKDSQLLRDVAATKRGATIRIWENPQCLVVTRKETRFPQFAAAKAAMEAAGWPVVVRDSGGSAVPHHPGILNLSLILPQLLQPRFDLDTLYLALCEPIILALQSYGIKATYGDTPGSYCDGRFNLNVDGLKITGTAQRMMVATNNQQQISHGILAQAMLMVEADAAAYTQIVNRFYQLSGGQKQFSPTVATSLATLGLTPATDKTTLTDAIRTRLINSCALLCAADNLPQET
ncbi:lipoate--protein ligase family protein [Pontibacter sp. JAM-7]|uniref:lipoate--protein ligase family protein n=1 Tax=Pontibacter sp. JAM-7 TaxID=3366581 RepID=UPI003AF74FE2